MFVAVLVSVDIVVDLDVGLTGQLSVPVALGVVLFADFVLAVVEGLTLVISIATLSRHIPVELVVRDVLNIQSVVSFIFSKY